MRYLVTEIASKGFQHQIMDEKELEALAAHLKTDPHNLLRGMEPRLVVRAIDEKKSIELITKGVPA